MSKQVDRAGMHMGRCFGVFSEPARLNLGEVLDVGSIQGEVAGQRWWGQGEARTGGWVGPEAWGRPGRRKYLGHPGSKQVQHGGLALLSMGSASIACWPRCLLRLMRRRGAAMRR